MNQPASSKAELEDNIKTSTAANASMATTVASCQFLSYHGYSHTLQYFPVCDLLQEEKSNEPSNNETTTSDMNFPYLQDFKGGCHKTIDQKQSVMDIEDKRKKAGHQKRSWNTENYQWMNIKRTRKAQQKEGNNGVTIVFIKFYVVKLAQLT